VPLRRGALPSVGSVEAKIAQDRCMCPWSPRITVSEVWYVTAIRRGNHGTPDESVRLGKGTICGVISKRQLVGNGTGWVVTCTSPFSSRICNCTGLDIILDAGQSGRTLC